VKWLEVSIEVEPENMEILSQLLMEKGIQGLEIIDPEDFRRVLEGNRYLDFADDGLIDCYGNKTIVKAYFQADRDAETLKAELQRDFLHAMENPPNNIQLRLRDDSEWKDSWKKHYRTFFISKRVIIKPTWEDVIAEDDQIVIELDPGMAFGTGMHETTRMCAVLLDDLVNEQERVLDLGCGTGILGIIAAKLGARKVICVDIDDAACKTSEENIEKNHVADRVCVRQGELKSLKGQKFELVIMNIIADVILLLLPELKEYCCPGTNILLSGIIRERKQEVLDEAAKQGYRLIRELNEGEWVAMQLCTDF
jgi:ribosomal protein L11 methyltransferase